MSRSSDHHTEGETAYVTVVLRDRVPGLVGDGLTYASHGDVPAGALVRVPVRHRLQEGIVIGRDARTTLERTKIRAVADVLSRRPLLPTHLLATARWMSERYCVPLRLVLSGILPPPPWKSLAPKRKVVYTLGDARAAPRGAMQKRIVDALTHGERDEESLMEDTGAAKRTLLGLKKKGTVQSREVEQANDDEQYEGEGISVPSAWKPACDQLMRANPALLVHRDERELALLYAALAHRELKDGKSVIVLEPEQFLAERMVQALRALLPADRVRQWRAGASRGGVAEEFRLALSGRAQVIVGTRSALFAPVRDLGLVIVDGEHDALYKSERAPLFHAVSVASELCANAGARLLLSSPTPTLESWRKAREGDMTLCELPAHGARTPVTIVDLQSVQFGTAYPFSPTMVLAMRETLGRGERCVVFLNHLGDATRILCGECKEFLNMQHDGRTLTMYVAAGGRPVLRDRVSGATIPVPDRCPRCGAHALRPLGIGTRSAEELLRRFFPDFDIVRIDSDAAQDTTRGALLRRFADGHGKIAVGTQSVLPVVRSPGVTLTIALIADVGLSAPHLLAGERTLQLVASLKAMQTSSRSRLIIQTFAPDAREFAAIRDDAIGAYLDEELRTRKAASLPPYTEPYAAVVRGTDARARAQALLNELTSRARNAQWTLTPSRGTDDVWYVDGSGDEARAAICELSRAGHCTLDPHPLCRY